jgi:hypothetical protein
MSTHRRDVLNYTPASAAAAAWPDGFAQGAVGDIDGRDRVFITNEIEGMQRRLAALRRGGSAGRAGEFPTLGETRGP